MNGMQTSDARKRAEADSCQCAHRMRFLLEERQPVRCGDCKKTIRDVTHLVKL